MRDPTCLLGEADVTHRSNWLRTVQNLLMAEFLIDPLFMARKFVFEAIGATTYLLQLGLSGATNAGGLSKEVAEDPLEFKAESTDFCLLMNSKSRYNCISSSDVLRGNRKLENNF